MSGAGLKDSGSGAVFKDHFSGIADAYAAARPEYPDALFDAIAAVVPASARVWEPGCGSGQATRGLAARFAHVHATDPSAQQLGPHWAHAGGGNVSLAVEPAERTDLADASVQLVAVAQALHWFDRDRFFAQCERVLTPGGVLAAWGYPDFLAPEGMAGPVAAFRAQIEPHWPPERAQVDARYAGYAWLFPALPAPALWLEADWTLPHFLRYLASISASARCLTQTGDDPVARHAPALAAAWGDADDARRIQWPLFLRLRRKPG
ncbi:class I SAM-dependent methyltransferase [Lysobacter cavernae]|uniref:Class I SAM-dependent methyltransferase n=1 Tax=Lysobacter cavernae TaxID=1685901 RepID=A0ABV7RTL3_9GAMM